MLAGFEHFYDLPTTEKIKLVEEMWDNIATSSTECHLSQATLAEIRRRCEELDKDPDSTLTEEEMWRRVDELLDKRHG